MPRRNRASRVNTNRSRRRAYTGRGGVAVDAGGRVRTDAGGRPVTAGDTDTTETTEDGTP